MCSGGVASLQSQKMWIYCIVSSPFANIYAADRSLLRKSLFFACKHFTFSRAGESPKDRLVRIRISSSFSFLAALIPEEVMVTGKMTERLLPCLEGLKKWKKLSVFLLP